MIKKVTIEDDSGTYEIVFMYPGPDVVDVMLRRIKDEDLMLKRAAATCFRN